MDVPLMVFLHGPGMSPPAWQDVVTHINPTQPMVAPWLKGLRPQRPSPAGGAGASDTGHFDLGAAAGEVLDLMEARGAERADLIGFSLGGLVGLRAAALAPEQIAHLVLISTPAVPSAKLLARQRLAVKLMPASAFRDVPKAQVLAGLDALRAADIGGDLGGISTPTLVVIAEADPLGVASANAFRSELAAMVRTLPGADPNLLITAAGEVATLVADFCGGLLSAD